MTFLDIFAKKKIDFELIREFIIKKIRFIFTIFRMFQFLIK